MVVVHRKTFNSIPGTVGVKITKERDQQKRRKGDTSVRQRGAHQKVKLRWEKGGWIKRLGVRPRDEKKTERRNAEDSRGKGPFMSGYPKHN